MPRLPSLKRPGYPLLPRAVSAKLEDVRALMHYAQAGICGAITGRAIYEGTLDLATAQAMVDSFLATD
ncbi:MAG: hypothetical protein CM15mP74_14760 [Halieaceae bacterium]|nr:MAG: hypothetical protein CM15mP74_14760 [Halieaceae bacterium]